MKPSYLFFQYFLFFLFFLVHPLRSEEISPAEYFNTANEFYKSRQYLDSQKIYQDLLEQGQKHYKVYFNLGNVHLQLHRDSLTTNARPSGNHLGQAITLYEQALRLKPGDPDIVFNLEYAKKFIVDRIEIEDEGINPLLKIFFFFYFFDSALLNLLAAIMLFLLALSLSASLVMRSQSKNLLLLAGGFLILFVLFLSLMNFKKNRQAQLKVAIVRHSVIHALTEPLEGGEPAFQLHEGTKVHIAREDGDWVNLYLENGMTGWCRKSQLYFLSSNP